MLHRIATFLLEVLPLLWLPRKQSKSDKDENSLFSYRDEEDTSEYIRSILNFCQRAAKRLFNHYQYKEHEHTDMLKKEKIPGRTNLTPKERHHLNHSATNIRTNRLAGRTYRMANIMSPRRMSNFMFFRPFLSAFLRWPDIKSSAFAESPRGWSLPGMVTGRTWADVQLEGMMRWSVRRYQGPERRRSTEVK
jgi:hypothetical protein